MKQIWYEYRNITVVILMWHVYGEVNEWYEDGDAKVL